MKSYTIGRNLYGSLTKNTDSTNLTLGDQLANDFYRHLCAKKDWPFLERLRTLSTTASTQFTTLPYDCDQVREIAVIPTGTTTRYTPKQSPSRQHWDMLNMTSTTSDIPQWWFVFNGQVGLWPTPTSSSNTINVTQKTRVVDLSVADYTTGTITTATAGSTAIVGSGTTWTSQMVGRYIRITLSDTANTGDGLWYEIAAVGSATALTLNRAYGGTSIVAGTAAYNIGQMPLLPEAFHDTPWKFAAAKYWAKEDDKRSTELKEEVLMDIRELYDTWSAGTTDYVVDDGNSSGFINPNLTIRL